MHGDARVSSSPALTRGRSDSLAEAPASTHGGSAQPDSLAGPTTIVTALAEGGNSGATAAVLESPAPGSDPIGSSEPTESAAPGSSVPMESADISATTTRPSTRLQCGIHKPKIFTDGCVPFGNLATVGEPTNL